MNVRKNGLEWLVFAAALLIVGGSVYVLVANMTRGSSGPADLTISTGPPERVSAGYRVAVRVRNGGGETAEDVQVAVALAQNGRDVETAELSFAFVPRGSVREGTVVFRRDPSCCEISVQTLGWAKP